MPQWNETQVVVKNLRRKRHLSPVSRSLTYTLARVCKWNSTSSRTVIFFTFYGESPATVIPGHVKRPSCCVPYRHRPACLGPAPALGPFQKYSARRIEHIDSRARYRHAPGPMTGTTMHDLAGARETRLAGASRLQYRRKSLRRFAASIRERQPGLNTYQRAAVQHFKYCYYVHLTHP